LPIAGAESLPGRPRASRGEGCATPPRMIFMEPRLSPGIALLSSVIVWILTTSYRWSPVGTSLSKPLSPRRPNSREHGFYRDLFAFKYCLFTCPNMPRVNISTKISCVSSPFPALQRWADRPPLSSLYVLINKPLPPALIIPTAPFYRSAHGYGAGNCPRLPGSTPSRGFPFACREAL